MLNISEYYIDLEMLKQYSGTAELCALNVMDILPFQPSIKTSTGRRFQKIIVETIDEQFSAMDRFSQISDYEYLLYLGNNKNLAQMKINLIVKEISRKVESYVQEKYFPAPELNNGPEDLPEADLSLPVNAEKWKPPVEAAPRKIQPDSEEKRKMADRAMLEMLQAREGKSSFVEPLRISKSLNILYTPVWNVPKNHLTAFIATGQFPPLDPANRNFLKDKAHLDIGLLLRATGELSQLAAEGSKVVLIVPVSLATLDSYPFRNLYLQYCNELLPELKSLLVLKIEHIDQNIPLRRLDDILREPASFVRSVILSTNLQSKNYNAPGRAHVHGFSVSLNDFETNEKIAFKLLDRFAAILQEKHKTSMVEDIATTSLLCAAIGAGASYVSGPAVQPPQSSMNKVTTFDLVAVYQKNFLKASGEDGV